MDPLSVRGDYRTGSSGRGIRAGASLPGKTFNVCIATGIVALHEFGDAAQVEHAGVYDNVTPCAAIIADDDAVVFAKAAFDVVKRSFAAVGCFAENFGVIGVHHVQGEQHQIFSMRALGRHRL